MAKLPILYKIQTIDSRLLALKKAEEQIGTDPNRIALTELITQSEQRLGVLREEQQRVSLEQKRIELELKTCQERRKSEETKLYSGSVTASRELELLQQKIAESAKSQAKQEEMLLHLMEREEELTQEIGENEKRLELARKDLATLEMELKQRQMELAMETEDLRAEQEELLPQIPADWLARYHRIAGSHNGVAVARLKQESCGACHISQSQSQIQKVKRGDDQLLFCENCGRILYYGD
ncbi:MAG TPA: C4-type zinc ribbon domain-containing protein [Bacillota bacterium]